MRGLVTAGRVETLRDRLVKVGVRPSYSRILVLDYLLTNRSHPTADEVHSSLVRVIPTLSKTTVYNTLNLLVNAGLAMAVTIEGHETRYDGTVATHGHFKCRECGRVYDFNVDADQVSWTGLKGFRIEKKEVYFRGICPQCIDNDKNTRADPQGGRKIK